MFKVDDVETKLVGNQIGSEFCEVFCDEHGIQLVGKSGHLICSVGVYCNEASRGGFVPRAVLMDHEPGTMVTIRTGSYGKIFWPGNIVYGQSAAGDDWARGHCNEAALGLLKRFLVL
ncbi:tubulin beta-3 chain-like [Eucalyptus grandis]|uniref:tubulin beta-3 chain-like n=1 Tax=Eucalyptus grandis TaxID=71139 RepID=UPI000525C538|nr:tubulin beta-3 chain-like [Eucalyptus grandis]